MKLAKRKPRIDYRRELASFVAGPAPFLSLYLAVAPGQARDGARTRLLTSLDEMGRQGAPLTPAQWAAAGDALPHLEDDDATLVGFVDADGRSLVTGYPEPPQRDLISLDGLPRFGPLLRAEQGLVHHLVAIIDDGHLVLATVPRHGETTETVLAIEDREAVPAMIQRAARASQTFLVVLCAPGPELAWLEPTVRSGLPIDVSVSAIDIDGHDDESLAEQMVVDVSTHTARKTVELIRLWRFHQVHGEAVSGAVAAIDSIVAGRASLVLLNDDLEDVRTLPFDLVGHDHGLTSADSVGNGQQRSARWQDVVIRAALLAHVPLHMVPDLESTLDDGVGVVLDHRADPDNLAAILER